MKSLAGAAIYRVADSGASDLSTMPLSSSKVWRILLICSLTAICATTPLSSTQPRESEVFNPFRKSCIFEITRTHDSDFVRTLKLGDVILVRTPRYEFINSLIAQFTRSPYSHVAVYVGDGWCVSAGPRGVTLDEKLINKHVDVMRLKDGPTERQLDVLIENAYESIGKPYDFLRLFGFPYRAWKSAAETGRTKAFICSEHTAWSFSQAGIELVSSEADPGSILAPADIAHSDKLDWVGSWDEGRKVEEAVANRASDRRGESSRIARIVIRMIADPYSNKDDHYRELHAQSL
jgi:cell wall-associated NlpC family hydrolase